MFDQNETPKINPAFCTYADFSPHFASGVTLTEAQVLAMSRTGRFPKFCRVLNSQRSVALFSRQEIADYWCQTWTEICPAACASLLAAGFPELLQGAEVSRPRNTRRQKDAQRKARYAQYREAAKVRREAKVKDASDAG